MQQAYIKASNAAQADFFGSEVTLNGNGNTLAVYASGEDSNATGVNAGVVAQANNAAGTSGAVYIFIRVGGIWAQQAYVKASNTEGSDFFGTSISLTADGNTLAVGARQERGNGTGINPGAAAQADNSVVSSGAVYLFTRSGATWVQHAYIKSSNTGRFDLFGESLKLSDDGALAVGAFQEESNATGIGGDQTDNSLDNTGAVYLY